MAPQGRYGATVLSHTTPSVKKRPAGRKKSLPTKQLAWIDRQPSFSQAHPTITTGPIDMSFMRRRSSMTLITTPSTATTPTAPPSTTLPGWGFYPEAEAGATGLPMSYGGVVRYYGCMGDATDSGLEAVDRVESGSHDVGTLTSSDEQFSHDDMHGDNKHNVIHNSSPATPPPRHIPQSPHPPSTPSVFVTLSDEYGMDVAAPAAAKQTEPEETQPALMLNAENTCYNLLLGAMNDAFKNSRNDGEYERILDILAARRRKKQQS
jgi:hypothetical protein